MVRVGSSGSTAVIDQRIAGTLHAHTFEEVFLPPALEHAVGDLDVAQVPSAGHHLRLMAVVAQAGDLPQAQLAVEAAHRLVMEKIVHLAPVELGATPGEPRLVDATTPAFAIGQNVEAVADHFSLSFSLPGVADSLDILPFRPSFIERPRQVVVFELPLEARPDELVAVTLPVGLQDIVVLHHLKQHRQRVHPPVLLRTVYPTHLNGGVVDHVGLANSVLNAVGRGQWIETLMAAATPRSSPRVKYNLNASGAGVEMSTGDTMPSHRSCSERRRGARVLAVIVATGSILIVALNLNTEVSQACGQIHSAQVQFPADEPSWPPSFQAICLCSAYLSYFHQD